MQLEVKKMDKSEGENAGNNFKANFKGKKEFKKKDEGKEKEEGTIFGERKICKFKEE